MSISALAASYLMMTSPLARTWRTGLEFRLGDVVQGFQDADVIVEKDVSTAAMHQGYIEPHSATAMWNRDGHLTIWSSS